MKDEHSANSQTAIEVVALRRRNAELEASEAERDRAWAWLRQNEEHYRTAVENVADAIVITVGTSRVFVNQAFLSLHELDDMSQASGLALDHFIVAEDRPMVKIEPWHGNGGAGTGLIRIPDPQDQRRGSYSGNFRSGHHL